MWAAPALAPTHIAAFGYRDVNEGVRLSIDDRTTLIKAPVSRQQMAMEAGRVWSLRSSREVVTSPTLSSSLRGLQSCNWPESLGRHLSGPVGLGKLLHWNTNSEATSPHSVIQCHTLSRKLSWEQSSHLTSFWFQIKSSTVRNFGYFGHNFSHNFGHCLSLVRSRRG